MKRFLYILIIGIIVSCSNKTSLDDELNEYKDSSISKINIYPKDSTNYFDTEIINVTYSLEHFYYGLKYQKFICKTTSIDKESFGARTFYSMKKEFFDYRMGKAFEIESKNRQIEIKRNYYITHDLFNTIPDYFELYNYGNKDPFVKCTGLLWKVEIPNSQNIAYFGYRKSLIHKQDSSLTYGTVYYSVNQTTNYEITIKAQDRNLFKSNSEVMGIKLKPNNPNDKFNNYSTLLLWSKEGMKEINSITDFNLIITVGFKLSDNDLNNNEIKEYSIPIINGLVFGEELANKKYEYTIKK